MDILQLLEVLRPSDHILTVKLDNNESDLKIGMGILIALFPVLVAALSLFFTSRQFKKSLNQQMDNFEKGYKQQAKVAQLTATLATEAEIKKEWCRDVRKYCVEMMSCASAGHRALEKYNGFKRAGLHTELKVQSLYDEMQKNFDKMFELITYLDTYIDKDNDTEFRKAIHNIANQFSEPGLTQQAAGTMRGICLRECKNYINKKMNEISGLSKIIDS